MDSKTLTKAFCKVKRMRLGSVELKQHIDNLYGSEENLLNNNLLFSNTFKLPGMTASNDLLKNLTTASDNKANMLEFDSTQLHLNATIDFDETTTFELTVWNLKDENEIIVGDQIELQLYWENYTFLS